MAPSRRPKDGTTRYRRNWDTVSLEVLWRIGSWIDEIIPD